MRRPAVLLLVALLCCGCGGADLTKQTFPRTVVPPDGGSGLTTAGLRLVDPCGLLDPAVLSRYGTPDENVAQDFDTCRNYMRDAGGQSLSMSVRVGETLTTSDQEKATEELGGFKARVTTVEGACFVTLVMADAEPVVGVTLQTGYDAAEPCPIARDVAASVAGRLTGNPPRTPRPGSLVPLDPCTAPAPAGFDAEADPFGLHQCSWRTEGGAELELQYAQRLDPAKANPPRRPDPVDLDGVTAWELRSDESYAECQLTWVHLAGPGDVGDVVDIEVRDVGDSGIDVCEAAATFAKGLLPTLPKP